MDRKVTAPAVKAMKGGDRKIVCVTAYDFVTGWIADEAGVDLVLVGDSVGNVVLGLPNTLPVTLAHMAHHTSAVSRGVERALLVADMPFGSYNSSAAQAVESAVTLVQSGAEAVKLEGLYLDEIERIVKAGIPVMGHLGMTPQSVNNFGGFKVQGRGEAGPALLEAARSLQNAGVFGIVLELIPSDLAESVTRSVDVPTIGIGAGAACDGQIQVFHDVAGLGKESFRHAKRFAEGAAELKRAVSDYADEVRSGAFPTRDHGF